MPTCSMVHITNSVKHETYSKVHRTCCMPHRQSELSTRGYGLAQARRRLFSKISGIPTETHTFKDTKPFARKEMLKYNHIKKSYAQ